MNFDIKELERVLGKYGAELWHKSQGKHSGTVTPFHEAKSISTENTFEENKTEMAFSTFRTGADDRKSCVRTKAGRETCRLPGCKNPLR